ncbi:hypothetical protein PG984_014298 [Apiospora sp. TS-2023a]
MFFTNLPREIIYLILLEAVRVRGTKRAQRLRYVSKAWKVAVDEAIIQLGDFARDGPGYDRAPYWPEYTLQAALRLRWRGIEVLPGEKKEPLTLRLLRHVAERVARHAHPDTYSEDVLKEYIVDISKMGQARSSRHYDEAPPRDPWFEPMCAPTYGNIEKWYHRLLLAAAAWTNQVGLVKKWAQSLPLAPDNSTALCGTFHILEFALAKAAFRGHNKPIRVLLDALEKVRRVFDAHDIKCHWGCLSSRTMGGRIANTTLAYASRGNRLSTVKMFVRLEEAKNISLEAGFDTTSLEIFQMIYPLIERRRDRTLITMFSGLERFVEWAILRGAVPIIDYLFRKIHPESVSWSTSNPPFVPYEFLYLLDTAARHGRQEAVVYLLTKGWPVFHWALEAGVRYGSPAIVQLLLERAYCLMDTRMLTIAVEKENEKVLQMLLDARSAWDDAGWQEKLVAHARKLGLESMERLLLEHREE